MKHKAGRVEDAEAGEEGLRRARVLNVRRADVPREQCPLKLTTRPGRDQTRTVTNADSTRPRE
jgi:hypothetical protein